jgi:hypothetical protein
MVSITPALAYLSHAPLLDGIVDTSPLLFNAGILYKKTITDDVVSHKTVVVDYYG